MLIPLSDGGRTRSNVVMRTLTGSLVVAIGMVTGVGGLLVHIVRGVASVQLRTQQQNNLIVSALDQLTGVGIAYADAPTGGCACGGGSCGSCGCGCGCGGCGG